MLPEDVLIGDIQRNQSPQTHTNLELRIHLVAIHFSPLVTGQPPCKDAGSLIASVSMVSFP